MDNRRMLFLINPHAGKAEIKGKALDLIDLFVRGGWEVTVHTTQRRLEIADLLPRRAGQYGLIVCSGGDGTLNETITGLMRCPPEGRPPVGYIPAGTVNDFASSLGISKNMHEATATILSGEPFLCDVGAFGDRYFSYIAAFGAFTDVSYQTPQQSKNLLGRAAYFLEAILRLPAVKAYRMSVTHDGETVEGEFLFGMVTNATSVGGFKLRAGANISMNDGLLEAVFLRNPKTALEAQALVGAVLRQEYDSEFVTAFRTTRLTVRAEEKVPWTLDGEFGGTARQVRIANCPRAIRVITAPAGGPAGDA